MPWTLDVDCNSLKWEKEGEKEERKERKERRT